MDVKQHFFMDLLKEEVYVNNQWICWTQIILTQSLPSQESRYMDLNKLQERGMMNSLNVLYPKISKGELKLLLGIQIHQSPRGIFINQAKYASSDTKSLSTSGGIQFLGGDKLVSWSFTKADNCTSMSSAEAEYVSLSACWLHTSHSQLVTIRPAFLYSNRCQISLHKGTCEKGIVELFFVGTEYQLADLFTKALSEDRFKYLVRRLGMRCLTPDELEVLAIEFLLDPLNINCIPTALSWKPYQGDSLKLPDRVSIILDNRATEVNATEVR
ncbi:hypothetical protein Tco_0309346 [Tanacetum coccineum]